MSVTGGPFRVRVVSPLEATEADLARRQRRYGAHAGPGTLVTVDNLAGGPAALDTSGDRPRERGGDLPADRRPDGGPL